MISHYNDGLVALSVLIAILGSYAALDLARRTRAARGARRLSWLTGGATAMGLGIWAMHYIEMLAFHLPVPVLCDVPCLSSPPSPRLELTCIRASLFDAAVEILSMGEHGREIVSMWAPAQ